MPVSFRSDLMIYGVNEAYLNNTENYGAEFGHLFI